MAEGFTYVCTHCKFSLVAWDDGNPYFLSDNGKPQFFYHPSGESQLQEYIEQSEGRYLTGSDLEGFLADRTGNMSDMLCLDCGMEFRVDLDRKEAICNSKTCESANVVSFMKLEGKQCPKCKEGVFREDETCRAIS